jgi:acetyl esterase/lipase
MPRALIEERDIRYGMGGDVPLLLDILRPTGTTGPRPAVIYVHGGGWGNGERWSNPNELLAMAGFVTASISYRFRQQAIFPAQIHDVKAAIRFLRANAENYGLDPDRIGIWGHSAGGQLAALAGTSGNVPGLEGESGSAGYSSRVQAVVPISAPTDFVRLADIKVDVAANEMLGGSPRDAPHNNRLASPTTHIDHHAPPFLIVHGNADDVVPFDQATLLRDALHRAGCDATLLELAGVNHDVFDPAVAPAGSMRDHIVSFFLATLGPLGSADQSLQESACLPEETTMSSSFPIQDTVPFAPAG